MFEKKKTMKCRLILCILIVLSIQLVLSHAVKKSTHKMKSYMERVAGKKCGPKCQARRNRRARRNQARRKQEDLDNRILPNVKTDNCGLNRNACFQVNNEKCGKIVWDEPFYKEECDKISGRNTYYQKDACEEREKESRKYIDIDMLKVNKEGTQTIYDYDCDENNFRDTQLCKDMMKSSSTCKCKPQTYEIFGGDSITRRGGFTTEYQSILRLHIKCENNKMSWRVEAKRCPIRNHDANCDENDDHRRRRRRRRLLQSGAKAC